MEDDDTYPLGAEDVTSENEGKSLPREITRTIDITSRPLVSYVGDSPEQTATTIARRQRIVSDMYVTGHTIMEIADALGVGHSTIGRDVQSIREEWAKTIDKNAGTLVAREQARLEWQIRELAAAWERSKLTHTKTTIETRAGRRKGKATGKAGGTAGDPAGDAATGEHDETDAGQTVKRESEDSPGDPRYQALILAVAERLARLLNLDTPKETNTGAAPVIKVVSGISMDDV